MRGPRAGRTERLHGREMGWLWDGRFAALEGRSMGGWRDWRAVRGEGCVIGEPRDGEGRAMAGTAAIWEPRAMTGRWV